MRPVVGGFGPEILTAHDIVNDEPSDADQAGVLEPLAAALGNAAMCPEEFAAFSAALMSRHPSAIRYRNDIDPQDFAFPVRPIP